MGQNIIVHMHKAAKEQNETPETEKVLAKTLGKIKFRILSKARCLSLAAAEETTQKDSEYSLTFQRVKWYAALVCM